MPDAQKSQTERRIARAFLSYAKVIGELVWASTYSLGRFQILFCHVIDPRQYAIGLALWNRSKSDRDQLEMLLAAAKDSERLTSEMREHILWVTNQAIKLGELRNQAVHSATFFREDGKRVSAQVTNLGTPPGKYKELKDEPNLKRKFQSVKDDLLHLTEFVNALWPTVAGFDALPPLPQRPQLKSTLPKAPDKKKPRPKN